MKDKFRIQPGSAQETLIVPLYARKKCTERFPDFYQDPLSVELCQRIDYDFSVLDKMYNNFMYEFGAL